jgi:hypothetical protein
MKNHARVSKHNFTKTIPLYYQVDSKIFFIIIPGQFACLRALKLMTM